MSDSKKLKMISLSMKEPRPKDKPNKLSTWIQKFKKETDLCSEEYYQIVVLAYTYLLKRQMENIGRKKEDGPHIASIIKSNPEDVPISMDDIDGAAYACGYTIVWVPALSRHPGYER